MLTSLSILYMARPYEDVLTDMDLPVERHVGAGLCGSSRQVEGGAWLSVASVGAEVGVAHAHAHTRCGVKGLSEAFARILNPIQERYVTSSPAIASSRFPTLEGQAICDEFSRGGGVGNKVPDPMPRNPPGPPLRGRPTPRRT